MTDSVFSTQPTNTPIAGQYLPGGAPGVVPPPAVPPYTGANSNTESALALASRGALRLNEPITLSTAAVANPLFQLSPATVNGNVLPAGAAQGAPVGTSISPLHAMAIGQISHQNIP